MDAGFIEGRQYGRGASGAQRRDENRQSYDPSRGGPAQRGYQDQSILSRIGRHSHSNTSSLANCSFISQIGGAKRERSNISEPSTQAVASTTTSVDHADASNLTVPPPVANEPTAEEEKDNDIDEDDRHKSKRVRRTDE